jgi:mitotic spindle assembly checkpoint protein MAD2
MVRGGARGLATKLGGNGWIESQAAGTETATRSVITLKGSVEIVTEFFGYAINSILFQRGIYAPESFVRVSKYGLPMLVTNDESLKSYLSHVLSQVSAWLTTGQVQSLVVVITGADSGATLERWVFKIDTDKEVTAGG